MSKLLRSRDILLLGLSGGLDLFEEVRDPLHLMSKSYDNMYGWVPRKFRRHNFNHLVWRSIKTGYIEKVEKNGEVFLRLTSQGSKKITRDFPLISLQRKSWDKNWRVVIFDIEEKRKNVRDKLRAKLKELGFGMLQESVFISPHDVAEDISEFIEHIGLKDVSYVFETNTFLVGDQKELARKVWKLDFINERYKILIGKIENIHLNLQRGRVNKLNRGNVDRIKKEYLEIVLQDPFLPKELLFSDWKGYVVKELIKKFS